MGEIIEIQEELNPFCFRIRFTVTNEERIVSINPEKRELFSMQNIRTLRPMACPFLRETDNKKFICSAHLTRPDLCRQYSCYRILVLDSYNRKVGRVMDASRYFSTTDEDLRLLWNREIANVIMPDEKKWEEYVEHTLVRAGYHVL